MATLAPLPRPQPKQLSDGSFETFLLILCATWTLGSLFILFFCTVSIGPDWYRYLRLHQTGVTTEGLVTNRNSGKAWLFFTYEFQIDSSGESAQPITGQQVVHHQQPAILGVGEPVMVRYLADNPDVSALEPYFSSPGKAPLVIVAMGIIFTLIGLILLPKRWQVWSKQRRLATHGRLASAKIINRWRTVDERDRSLYCLAYEFRAESPSHHPRLILAAEDNYEAYYRVQIGQTVPVRYVPDDPERCRLVIE